MTFKEFDKIVDDILSHCRAIMKSKGAAYSGKDDKLANFKRIATKLKLHPMQVWSVYFNKHIDAIDAYIRYEYSDSEAIDGRIMDAINYLLLLYGLIREERSGK